jgi:hypothetical protein
MRPVAAPTLVLSYEQESHPVAAKLFVPNTIAPRKVTAEELFPGSRLWHRFLRAVVGVPYPIVLWNSPATPSYNDSMNLV